jgi:hypothetical protein
MPHIIDIDVINDGIFEGTQINKRPKRNSRGSKQRPCEGISIAFPEGKDQHTSYPFGMHSKRTILWNYKSIDNTFYIQAKTCQKWSSKEGSACDNCEMLTLTMLYTGIMDHIMNGAHESIPLVYHGVRGLMTIAQRKTDMISRLHMTKLNDSRKLLVKVGMLEDHKQLILAIASGSAGTGSTEERSWNREHHSAI